MTYLFTKDAPTISGHTDFYYPNLTFQVSHFQQELPEISKMKHVPIPPELEEQFSREYQKFDLK